MLMEHVHFGACMVMREILHDSHVDGGNDSSNVDGNDRSWIQMLPKPSNRPRYLIIMSHMKYGISLKLGNFDTCM